jgi:hypothetical protein
MSILKVDSIRDVLETVSYNTTDLATKTYVNSSTSVLTGGTSGQVLTSSGGGAPTWATAASGGNVVRQRVLTSGTVYTTPSDVKKLFVMVTGATGGVHTTAGVACGGSGGGGYAEKFYASPATSYNYAIGAAGTNAGTTGGTTMFDTISITGSGGVQNTLTGSTGGIATGGDYTANGGAGGAGAYGGGGGGGGGASGSRAGDGYAGGAGYGSGAGGGGGGTGSAGSPGSTTGGGGTYATSISSTVNLGGYQTPGVSTFTSGLNAGPAPTGCSTTSADGGNGASSAWFGPVLTVGSTYGSGIAGLGGAWMPTRGNAGLQGCIVIWEYI